MSTVRDGAVAGLAGAARRLAPLWRTIIVGIYLIVVPSRSYSALLQYDEQRVAQVLLLAVLAVGLLPGRTQDFRRVVRVLGPWRWLAVAALVVGVISGAFAADPFTAWLDIGLMVGLCLVALSVAVDVVRAAWLTPWLLAVAAVVSLSYYAADLLTLPGVIEKVDRLWLRVEAGGFDNVRHMNQYQALLLPFCAALIAAGRVPTWVRGLVLGISGVIWWMLLVSSARGALVALAVAAGIMVACRGSTARRGAAALGLGALFGAAAAAVTHWREVGLVEQLGGVEGMTSTSGRLQIWRDVLGQVLEQPLLGVGPGHLAHVQRLEGDAITHVVNHPHNALLQVAAEWGVPVGLLVAATGLMIALLMAGWHPASRADGIADEVLEAAVAALLTGLALSLVSGVLVTPVASTSLAAVGGVVLGTYTVGTSPPPNGDGSRVSGLLAIVVALIAVAGPVVEVVGTTPEERRQDARAYAAGLDADMLGPRFWAQGLRGGDWEPPPEPVPISMPAWEQRWAAEPLSAVAPIRGPGCVQPEHALRPEAGLEDRSCARAGWRLDRGIEVVR